MALCRRVTWKQVAFTPRVGFYRSPPEVIRSSNVFFGAHPFHDKLVSRRTNAHTLKMDHIVCEHVASKQET